MTPSASIPIRVLLLEDSQVDAEVMLGHLRVAGYDVESVCVDREASFVAALEQKFDVILSDYSLPQWDGMAALAEVQRRGLEIPFIIVSGHLGEELAVSTIKAGAADFISKDHLLELPAKIQAALAQFRMRADRNRAVEELRQSEAKFRSYVDNAPVAIFVANRVKQIVDFNKAALELIGCDAATLSAMTTDDLYPLEERRLVFLARQELTAKGWSETEMPILRRDGRRIWVSARTVMLDQERSIGFFTDITARKLAAVERQALEAQYRQAQKMEAIGRLAGGVAHDFNNMLAVIQGYASSLLSEEPLTARQNEALQEITRASERATALTRQLLLFSRKQVLEMVHLQINDAVTGVAKMLGRILGEDVALETRLEANLPMVAADVGMLEQALLNLVVNSRDAMPQGGKLTISTAAVTLDLKQAEQIPDAMPGPCVRLSITDTGAGIAPDVLPRIFEPFFTTKEVGKGTGLGLATVHGIVKQHGGWITVESELKRGTTFHLFFRAVHAAHVPGEAPRPAEVAPTGSETILLVEDEQPLRVLIASVLERCGYQVVSAVSGREALTVWETHRDRVKLLLTDIVMPGGVTGPDLASRLCAQNAALKVIFTSGYAAEAGSKFTLVEGVNFLQKPCHPIKLAQTVRARLDSLDLLNPSAIS
ncbi:MAG TPA: response regulator [Verrucomicrobiae bacterium]|jgi:PAS domain S-box-containing protein|nr:response regulator [Verrucomicrobiae bacterium]